jgi:hypothetical protein
MGKLKVVVVLLLLVQSVYKSLVQSVWSHSLRWLVVHRTNPEHELFHGVRLPRGHIRKES